MIEVKLVPHTEGVTDEKPRQADGSVLHVSNVVWSTGFDFGPEWIKLPVFGDSGEPL
jgi:putative flavoprotein involved in K+ transport